MKTFNQDWKNWITTNVNAGQDKNGLFKILLDEGYAFETIVEEMNYRPTVALDQLINPFVAAGQKKAVEPQSNNTNNHGTKLDRSKLFMPNAVKLDSDALELYTIENFLNADECAEMVDSIKSRLRPSELASADSDKSFRTSSTCVLGALENPFIKDIDNRICRMLGVDSSYSETIQGQYYEVGQEFKAHTDYFESYELDNHSNGMGQRTYTFMIYLNEVEEGGETAFTKVGQTFTPQTGMAVIWSSLNADGSPNSYSMHHAQPVIKGYKAIITKWFRSYSNKSPAPAMFSKEINEYIPNYTRTGFYKTQLLGDLHEKLLTFYKTHQDQNEKEHVPGDFIFSGDSSTKKPSSILLDMTASLREEVHDAMKPILEDWCGKALEPTYVYGIRTYLDKAVLRSHRDRIETHIISAILNVDQDVNEDWPLVIEDNYYREHYILLKPGQMVFYEGGRLTHGRPIAFNGRSFANVFCHFKPTDYIPIVN